MIATSPDAERPPPQLAGEPIAGEIGPGERHRFLLDPDPHRWMALELEQRELDLDLSVLDAAGNTLATAATAGNWRTEELDLLVADDAGVLTLEVAASAGAARRGGYELRLSEDRPARPDDSARRAARQRLREIVRSQAGASTLSAAEAEAELRALLGTSEISWSADEAARIGNALGKALLAQSRARDAAEAYRAALARSSDAVSRRWAAELQDGLASSLARQGLAEEALEQYRAAIESARAIGDQAALAVAANHEALLMYRGGRGDPAAAVARLEEVLTAPLDPPHRAPTLLNLAMIRHFLGDLEAALAHHREARGLLREASVEDVGLRFAELRTGGTLFRAAGEVEDALGTFEDALELALEAGHAGWEMSLRIHFASLLVECGNFREARQHLERSARLAEQAGSADYHARALVTLAWVELLEESPAAAAELLADAPTAGLGKDVEMAMRLVLGVARARLGESEAARELLTPLLEDAEEQGLRVPAAQVHQALASMHLSDGELDEAAVAIARAAELTEAIGDPLRRAAVHGLSARLEAERGRPAASLAEVEKALRLRESVRSELVGPDLRSSFLSRWRSDFDLAIDQSMRLAAGDPGAGHDRRAFELSEAVHARTLTELLLEAKVDVRQGISAELLAAERETGRRLSAAQGEVTRLVGAAAAPERIAAARHELDEARRRLDEVERQIRRDHSHYAEIRYPRPPGVEQVQTWLPKGTALLEYALGERSSVLFVVDAEGFAAVPLPPREEIATRVASVRKLLRAGTALTRRLLDLELEDLTRILVAPAAGRLLHVDHLLIVADRDLFHLPFEALTDPEAPHLGAGGLLRRWTVSYLPSAAVLPHLREEPEEVWRRDLLAFADPPPVEGAEGRLAGDDLRALIPPDGLPALPGAQREARSIAALFPADRVELYVGESARESMIKSAAVTSSARRLHIASHGVISVTDPAESFVLLAPGPADDGRLHLHEIFNLELGAELVVLSGCETGLGPQLESEGLIGLARGFLYAGARDLVVSLWPVSDDATEELMVDFYRQLLAGRSPAAALRSAKLGRLDRGNVHPFDWAPFVVFGTPAAAGQ